MLIMGTKMFHVLDNGRTVITVALVCVIYLITIVWSYMYNIIIICTDILFMSQSPVH